MGRNNLLAVGLDAMEELRTDVLEDAIGIVRWGIWSRGGIPTGKQPQGPTPNITDDEALRIDNQVAKLPGKPKLIIKEIYIWNKGVNELARGLGLSSRVVMGLRDQGLNIIYGALFGNT